MKKIFMTFSLIIIILLSVSNNAYSITYTDIEDEDSQAILELLASYNIINGYPDGTFKPNNCITRAEMAKIATILIGYDNFTIDMTSDYIDMQGHWAERYVDVINALDILKGYNDNNFKPDEYITYDDAVSVMIKILGYKDSLATEPKLDYYNNLTKKLGMIKNVNNPYTYMTRNSISRLIYNTLSCKTVTVKNNVIIENNTVLFDNIGRKETVTIDDAFALKHMYYDFSNVLFNTGDVYYNLEGKVVLVNNLKYTVVSGYIKSALSSKLIFLYDDYGNKTLYNLFDVPIIFNGISADISSNDFIDSKINIVISPEDPTQAMGAIVIKRTDVKVIGENDLYKQNSAWFADKALPVANGAPLYDQIKIYGAASSLSDIKENDVVYFYETKEANTNKSLIGLYVVRNTISGTFNKAKTVNYVKYYTINSKDYKISKDIVLSDTPSNNDYVTAILDSDNNILKLDINKYAKAPETYGLVLSVSQATEKLPAIKILSQNGTISTLTLQKNSGVVRIAKENGKEIYYTTVNANEYIKYDLLNKNNIKICNKIPTINIASKYNDTANTLEAYNYRITNATKLFLVNSFKYSSINKASLGAYLEGKGVVNASGEIEIMLIHKNVPKTTNTVNPEPTDNTQKPSTSQNYSGSLYGVIEAITSSNGVEYVKLFNSSYIFTVGNDLQGKLDSYKSSFINVTVKDNSITKISSYSPEVTKGKITGIYKGQLQIDAITYYEYSNNVLVFTCSKDSNGKYTSFKGASLGDIKLGSLVQFYDTDNTYDGVLDIIIILN